MPWLGGGGTDGWGGGGQASEGGVGEVEVVGGVRGKGGSRVVAVSVWGSGGRRGSCGGVGSMQMGGASGGGVVGVGRECVGVGGWAVVRVT